MVADFSKNLGVAFQILNDLKDWQGDSDNKLVAGQDVLAARPTLLLALALEGGAPTEREELLFLLANPQSAGALDRVRRIYRRAAVFDKAEKLIDKFRAAPKGLPTRRRPRNCGNCCTSWSITSSTARRRRSPFRRACL